LIRQKEKGWEAGRPGSWEAGKLGGREARRLEGWEAGRLDTRYLMLDAGLRGAPAAVHG